MANAQNVEQVLHNKPLQISGGVNASSKFHNTSASNSHYDPFFWLINGNLNLSVYGIINVPLSFIVSKTNHSLGTNKDLFHQFGISPNYKSITIHAGYRNMDFSRYTMSGITFLGGGIEYQPKNSMFAVKAFYGRFAAAKQYKSVSTNDPGALNDQPVFERWGYGTTISAGKKNHAVEVTLFKAHDEKNSISVPDNLDISPVENFVLGVRTKNRLTPQLSINLDYALSAYSTDTRQPEIEQETYSYSNNLGFLFTPRTSSQFNSAFNGNFEYDLKFATLGFSYKRIEPQYKSLGISFINNDVSEFTTNFATSLFKNKLSLSGNFGSQTNNLDNNQLKDNKRIITSANAAYRAGKNLNFMASFANFSSSATPTQIHLVDSIKYTQSNQNYSLSSNYNFGPEESAQGINLTTSYQKGNTLNQAGTNVTDIDNTFWNANLMYQLTFSQILATMFISGNVSTFETQNTTSTSMGPTLGVNKNLYNDKIRMGINSTLLNTRAETERSTLINTRFFTNYKINKHHRFNVGLSYLSKSSELDSVNQFQGSISYNYTL